MRTTRQHSRRVVVALSAAAALALAGCGFVNNDDGDDEPPGDNGGETVSGTLSGYVSTEQNTGLEGLFTAFEEESGVTLDVTSAAVADMNQQLSVQLSSGTAADLIRTSPGYSSPVAVGVLGSSGQLLDLSDREWVESASDGTRSLSDVDGKTFAFPVGQNAIVMAYNVDAFDELDLEVPTTWTELLDVSQKLQDSGRTPIAAGLTGAIYLQFYVYALAASIVYAEEPDLDTQMGAGEVDFVDHEGWNEVFEKFLELRDRGFLTEGALGVPPEQAMQSLATGESGMMLMVSAALPQLYGYAEGGAEDFAIFAMPATDDPDGTYMPTAPDFLAVNAGAENPDAALAFLDFLAEPANVETYANALQVFPGLNVGVEVDNPALDPVMPLVDEGRTAPYANYLWPNGDVQQTMLQAGQELYADEISLEELLTRMDADYDKGNP